MKKTDDCSHYSYEFEYSDIRVECKVEPNGMSAYEVYYNKESIYVFELSNEYQDKILEKTKSFSTTEKFRYFEEFQAKAKTFISNIEKEDRYDDETFKAQVDFLKYMIFGKICTILYDDFMKSRTVTTFQNDKNRESRKIEEPVIESKKEKSIRYESTEDMKKKKENTLAQLGKSGLIFFDKEKNEYCLDEIQMPTLFKNIKKKLNAGDIDYPENDDDSIYRFISNCIRDGNGNSLAGAIRQDKHRKNKK